MNLKKWGFVAVSMACTMGFAARTEEVVSPDRSVALRVTVGKNLTWEVARKGEKILLPAALGLLFKGQAPFGEMEIRSRQEASWDRTWENRLYKKQFVQDKANELTLHLQEKTASGRKLDLILRAYDTGVAFRYGIPAQPGFEKFVLTEDLTAYRFAENALGWFTLYAGAQTSEEQPFWKQSIRSIDSKAWIGSPMVIELGHTAAAISEADLTDWAGEFFQVRKSMFQPVAGAEITTRLSPRLDGNGAVVSAAPRVSPWRVVVLADSPLGLTACASDLILNLNPPPEGGAEAFAWVKPGATAWDWWADPYGRKEYMQKGRIQTNLLFAAEMGWPYSTIDGGWYGRPNHGPEAKSLLVPRPDLDFPQDFKLAKEKGVGIFLWLYWEELEKHGVEPTLALYEKWGVKGVKIDFMDRCDQEMVNWYAKVVRAGVKHHIIVNFHGAFKPTGMNRTWPNQITREGILGNEMNLFNNEVTPTHLTTLPFTRYLLGPADFTPGSFNNVHGEAFIPQQAVYRQSPDVTFFPGSQMGTRASALAVCVAFDSPLMTLCDWPEHYRGQPGLEALRSLPTVWKQTLPQEGRIGEFYTVARQSYSGDWYLASFTVGARRLSPPLGFLGEGDYSAEIYADSPASDQDAKAIAISQKPVTAASELSFDLVREGGALVIFRKQGKAKHAR